MADNEINHIIGGAHVGKRLTWDVTSAEKIVYLQGTNITVTVENVTSVNIRSTQDGSALKGALVAGLVGAVISQNMGGCSLVEINWKDGTQSLAKMTKGGDQILLASSYKSNAGFISQEARAKAIQQVKDEAWAELSPQEQRKKAYATLAACLLSFVIGLIAAIIGAVNDSIGLLVVAVIFVLISFPLLFSYLGKSGKLKPLPPKTVAEGGISVVIPDGTITITANEFPKIKYLSDLAEVTIPASVKKIEYFPIVKTCKVNYLGDLAGYLAIKDVWRLQESPITINGEEIAGDIIIPEGVTTIPEYAFYECSGITSVTFPQGVHSIENFAFGKCSGITALDLPVGLRTIGEGSFGGCSALQSVIFRDKGTTCAYHAFARCSALTSVTGSVDSLTSFFSQGSDLNVEEVTVTSGTFLAKTDDAGEVALDINSWFSSSAKKVTFAEGVTSIGPVGDFFSETETLVLPTTVKQIKRNDIFLCMCLEKVLLSEKTKYDIEDFPFDCELEFYDAVPPRTIVHENPKNKPAQPVAPAAPVQQTSSLDEIKKLKELLDLGLITQEEFDAKKKQLLGL